jgi:hypothetical protein
MALFAPLRFCVEILLVVFAPLHSSPPMRRALKDH